MFCENCGKQNPDGARFCIFCGKPMAVIQDASLNGQQVPRKDKIASRMKMKLISMIGGIVAFVVFGILGYLAVGGLGGLPDVEPSTGSPNQAYCAVFRNNGLNIPKSDFDGQDLTTVSYVIDIGDGVVENMEYVYDDGLVLVFVDTIYVPVSGMNETDRAQMHKQMQSNLKPYTDLSCCQLSSFEQGDFYVYKLIYTDLQIKENVHQLCSVDIVTIPEGETQVDQLGIKMTEDTLLATGYVKR